MAETNQSLKTPGQKYVNFDEYVDFHLVKAQASIKTTEIITALVGLAAGVLLYILTFVVLDQWVLPGGFGDTTRIVLSSSVLLIVLGVLAFRVGYPLLRHVHPLYAARMLEQAEPSLKSNLLNLVDVREAHAGGEAVVLRAMEKRAAVELSHVDIEQAVDRRKLLHFSYVLLAAVLVSCLYAIFSPKDLFTSMRRALFPTSPVAVPTQTFIADVTPGDARVPARTRLTVEADVRGRRPSQVTLYYTTADRKFVDEAVEMRLIDDHGVRYRGAIQGENGRGLMQDVTYRLEAGDFRTSDYAVTVIQPPSTRVEEVKYTYPVYTQLGEKIQTGIANIDGWEGTTVRVRATANVPLKSARIRMTDAESLAGEGKGEEVALQIRDGVHLEGEWKLAFRSDGTAPRFYHLEIKTTTGESDPEPTHYSLRIRPDQPPEVTLLSPNSNLERPANAIIPLVIQAADPDFELRFLTLKVERKGELLPEQKLFEGKSLGQNFRGAEDFPLKPLGLSKGDKLQFWIEAKDNRQPSANRSNTPRLTIDIVDPVSPQQVHDQLAEDRRQAQDQVASANHELNERQPASSPPRGEEKPPVNAPTKPQQAAEEKTGNPKKDPSSTGDENPGQSPSATSGEKNGDTRQNPATDTDAMEKLVQKELAKQNTPAKPEADQAQDDQVQDSDEKPAQTPPDENTEDSQKSPPKTPETKTRGQKNPPPNPVKNPPKKTPEKKEGSASDSHEQSEGEESSDSKQSSDSKKTKPGEESTEKSTGKNANSQASGKTARPKPGEEGKAGSEPGDGKNLSGEQPSTKPPTSPKGAPKSGSSNTKKEGDGQQPQQKPGSRTPEQSGTGKPQADDADGSKSANESGKKPQQGPPKSGDQSQDDSIATDPKQQPGKPKDKPGKGGSSGNEMPPPDQNPAAPPNPKPGTSPKPGNNSENSDSGSDNDQSPQPLGKSATPPEKNAANGDDATGDKPPAKTPPAKNGASPKSPPTAPDSGKESSETGAAGESDDGQGKAPENQPPKNGTKGRGQKPGSKPGSGESKPGTPEMKGSDSEKNQTAGGEKGTEGSQPRESAAGEDPPGTQPQPGKNPTETKPKDPKAGAAAKNQTGNPPAGADEEPAPGETKPTQSGQKKTGNRTPKTQDQIASTDPANDQQPSTQRKTNSRRPPAPANTSNPDQPVDPAGTPGNSESKTGASGQESPSKSGGTPSKTANKQTKPSAEKAGTGQPSTSPKSGSNDTSKKQTGDQQNPPEGSAGTDQKDPPAAGSQEKSGDGKSPKGASSQGKPQGGKTASAGKTPGGQGKAEKGGTPSGAPSQPGSTPSDSGGSPGEDQSGKGGDQAPGNESPNGGSHGGGGVQGGHGNAGQGGEPASGGDAANPEFARQATELVLKRLEKELARGEVDPQLLKELGWTKDRMAQFVQRMQEQLKDRGEDTSPEAVARRLQFEETLKNLQLTRGLKMRSGETANKRRTQHIQARDVPVPPEYRDSYKAYTKSLSKGSAGK